MKSKLLLLSCILFFLACGNDFCEELDCGQHGTCDPETETCVCDLYYEGEFCEEESRTKFIGTWSGTGECSYNVGNFFDLVVTIAEGSEVNIITIQSTQILQEFIFEGMVDQRTTIEVPLFQSNLGANMYDGNIVFEQSDNSILMTLNAYVGSAKSTCTYALTK